MRFENAVVLSGSKSKGKKREKKTREKKLTDSILKTDPPDPTPSR